MIGLTELLGGLLAAVLAVVGAWAAGTRRGRQTAEAEAKARDAKAADAMRERIDNADTVGNSGDALDWLRNRNPRAD